MSVLLLAIVLIGFAPTFHLKVFFATPALPLYLHVHGALLIAWFALFAAQTILVASGRIVVHRRLGLASVALVAALLPASIMTNLVSIARLSALAPDPTAFIEVRIFVVTLNFVLLAMFFAFFSLAIFVRRRPDWHKRLMLLASIRLVALARHEHMYHHRIEAHSTSASGLLIPSAPNLATRIGAARKRRNADSGGCNEGNVSGVIGALSSGESTH